MTEEIKKLLEYQEIDIELAKLEKAFAEDPVYRKYYSSAKILKSRDEYFAKYEEKSEALFKLYEELVNGIKEIEEDRAQLEKSAKENNDNRAIEYLKNQDNILIGKIDQMKASLDDLLKSINSLVPEYVSYRTTVKNAKETYTELKPEFEKINEKMKTDKREITKRLNEKGKEVSGTLLDKYKQRRADKMIPPIIYACDGAFCSYCHQELSGIYQQNLSKNNAVECENCHRILYKE